VKLLFISYFYPPLGGPAAIRSQKTVKYLSELGWEIDVFTVGDIEYNYHDDSLLTESRQHRIIRIPSSDPMALLKKLSHKQGQFSKQVYHGTPENLKLLVRRLYPLDDKVLWLPHLLKTAKKLLSSETYDLIYVSCGPFSSAPAARWLSRKFQLPYVLEMRDYWTLLSDYNLLGFAPNRFIARRTEKSCLKSAALVVTATQGIADDLATSFDPSLPDRTFVLFNGHDEADFNQLTAAEKPGNSYIISYFGAIYAKRNLKCLLRALHSLDKQQKLPEGFELRLYGNYHRETLVEIEQSGVSKLVRIIPQLEHRQALQQMLSSDALLLIINSDSPRGTLTSKVFEYLRSGKPILALCPQSSEVAGLLHASGQELICPMESATAIMKCLLQLFSERSTPKSYSYPASDYERSKQVAALHERLLQLI